MKMKRILQLVAVLAISLLTVQPIIAGCLPGNAMRCAPGCSMNATDMGSMSGMDPDCLRSQGDQLGKCSAGCCLQTAAQSVTALAAPDWQSQVVSVSAMTRAVVAFTPNKLVTVRAVFTAPAQSPPRYILNQAFRI